MPFLQPVMTRVASGGVDDTSGNILAGLAGTNLYVPKGGGAPSHIVVAAGVATILNGADSVQVSDSKITATCSVVATGQYLAAGNPSYIVASVNTGATFLFSVNPATGAPLIVTQDTPVFYSVMKPVV